MNTSPFDSWRHQRDQQGRFAGQGASRSIADTEPAARRPEPPATKRRHAVQPVKRARHGITIKSGVTQQIGD